MQDKTEALSSSLAGKNSDFITADAFVFIHFYKILHVNTAIIEGETGDGCENTAKNESYSFSHNTSWHSSSTLQRGS